MTPPADRVDPPGRRARAAVPLLVVWAVVGCTDSGRADCGLLGSGWSPGPCTRVSAATMSRLLDGRVRAEPDDRPGARRCRYLPVDGIAPYAELTFSRGGALDATAGGPPDIARELGTQPRLSASGTFVARRGDAQITIDVPGQPAPLALARRIAEALDAGCSMPDPRVAPAAAAST